MFSGFYRTFCPRIQRYALTGSVKSDTTDIYGAVNSLGTSEQNRTEQAIVGSKETPMKVEHLQFFLIKIMFIV